MVFFNWVPKFTYAVTMKLFLALCFLICISFSSKAQNEATAVTTYYLIRHAEKNRNDSSNKDPELNASGQKRAQLWRNYFKNIKLNAIYSTNYKRTLQTAAPTAEAKDLIIQNYDPNELYSEAFQKSTRGQSILIVGHSNTTPAFANAVLGTSTYPDIEDHVNSNLYILTISEGKIFQELITVESP